MTYIQVKTQFIGFHRWLEAPEETSFLQSLHRHLFIVRVKIEVKHSDREIEFFELQNWLKYWIPKFIDLKDCGSCEVIAEKLLKKLEEKYPKRFIEVNVSEDDENAGIVDNITYEKNERKN